MAAESLAISSLSQGLLWGLQLFGMAVITGSGMIVGTNLGQYLVSRFEQSAAVSVQWLQRSWAWDRKRAPMTPESGIPQARG
jgi:hypothetical protein